MDIVDKAVRSKIMARVRQKNTGPELQVRSVLHRLGYRFRLHRKDLPGSPDIVLPKYKTVIFVHGCFWHGHKDCRRGLRPTSNEHYWSKKIEDNITRDRRNQEMLEQLGWHVIIIWECAIGNAGHGYAKLTQLLLQELIQRNQ